MKKEVEPGKIAVIIVTFNGIKWIKDCLESLLHSSFSISIVVVDNNSSDGTVSFIRDNFGTQVRIIELKQNIGFGKGNNVGLRYVLKEDFDYVFLVNQDAIVHRDTINNLVAVASRHPEFYVLSPIHLDGSGKELESYFKRFMAENENKFYADHILNSNKKEIYEVTFINAAAWLLPIRTLNTIGGFDPIFDHYGEDDNYCQRVRFHGGKIGVVSNSFIRHYSKIRTYPQNYLFSDLFYKDYKRTLEIKYGDLNLQLREKMISQEKRKVVVRAFENIVNFRFYPFKVYSRLHRVIKNSFKDITRSRMINSIKKANYLELEDNNKV